MWDFTCWCLSRSCFIPMHSCLQLCRCFLESRGGKLPLHFSELPFLQWRLTMQPLVRLWNMRSLWEHWWQRSRCLIITPSTFCALQFTGCLHCWHWCFARDFFQIRQGRKICLLTWASSAHLFWWSAWFRRQICLREWQHILRLPRRSRFRGW